jgi:threonine/homoserine/homoserine lactone efflux protein
MLLELFCKGLLTGLLVSLPLGPMAVLVIQRTANQDFKSGFYTSLGVALTDTFWALIAGFSVSYIIGFLREYQSILQLLGAVVLFLLGFYIFRSHPVHAIRKYKSEGTSPLKCFFSAVVIALSNPLVILAYIAVFASTNVVFNIHHWPSPLVFITGFLFGSLTWWLIITTVINFFRHHFNLRILWWFNKISGALIMLFVIASTILIILNGSPSI